MNDNNDSHIIEYINFNNEQHEWYIESEKYNKLHIEEQLKEHLEAIKDNIHE